MPTSPEDQRKALTDLINLTYDKAGTLLALVGGAGYAGMLTIWGWVEKYLARWETLTVGALLGASLMLFIVWQLYGMFVMARQQMLFGQLIAVEGKDFDTAFATYQAASKKIMIRLTGVWRPALTAVAVPGVLGGVLLVVACVRHLLCSLPA